MFGAARDRRHIDLDLHTVPQVRMEVAVTGLTLAFGLAAIFVTAGTIAGDNTILVLGREGVTAATLERSLTQIMEAQR